MNVSQIRAILNTIDSISAVYIDANQIKSKNNLIFNTNDFKQNQNCSDIRPACSTKEIIKT
jgi:hypothetical protein